MNTYECSEELESRQEPTAIPRRTGLLEVKLREGHEVAIGQSNDESAGVESTDVLGGHHQNVGDAAKQAGKPETLSATQVCSRETGCAGTDESAESHQRRNELLCQGVEVPSERRVGCFMSKDLDRPKSQERGKRGGEKRVQGILNVPGGIRAWPVGLR